jgi:hypothetical protein
MAGSPPSAFDQAIWLVSFMHYDLGTSTWRQDTLQARDKPSAPGCQPCLRNGMSPMSPGRTLTNWLPEQDSNLRPSG